MRFLLALALISAGAGYMLTRPDVLPADQAATLATLSGDVDRGALVFAASGCASCHAAPNAAPDAAGADHAILSGGRAFASDFGTFYAPNISLDQTAGIGSWQVSDLANAVLYGTSPRGQHYYPAFPYTSYDRMALQDIADLWAYMITLPAASTPSRPHDVGFPFSMRRALGGWKMLFAGGEPTALTPTTAEEQRGQYLVEVLGHCGECHTPRNALGGLDYDRWLAGAPNPSGYGPSRQGRIPNITPAQLQWSKADLIEYFTSGFTPDYDSAGGEMVEVIENLSQLPDSDRAAIAAYLMKIPPVE